MKLLFLPIITILINLYSLPNVIWYHVRKNTLFLLVVNILYTSAMMLPDILELAKNNHY